MLLPLGSCSSDNLPEAITCRAGVLRHNGIRLKTVVTVGELTAPVSHVPLRCPNILYGFSGDRSSALANQMVEISYRSAGGKALFEINALGQVSFDEKFQVPVFTVTQIHSIHHIH
ncbi:MAG TPA: hypothetical protein VIA98_03185 [Allosphingosinicella sp.]|jgi:hypothetical protein